MTEPRTITLPTSDHGDVTLPEPAWCIGHPNHRPDDLRADILHRGPDVTLAFRGRRIMDASLAQSPFSTLEDPEVCSSTAAVSVSVLHPALDPIGVYDFAAALDSYADRLRALADELTALLAGGGQ